MLYRRKLDLDIEEIRPDLNTLRDASQELRTSSKFKQILQVGKRFLEFGKATTDKTLGFFGCRECFERIHLPWRCSRFPA